ncbi:SVEP1-like protein [Mya arenaria]|uniref:SVEP1-like protein n=1 Tax=Mya arenaria TaxID=6604 RepID=A0ABY7G5F5_MYAAR|nr:SVEP1-like protein [Mya arenaria]
MTEAQVQYYMYLLNTLYLYDLVPRAVLYTSALSVFDVTKRIVYTDINPQSETCKPVVYKNFQKKTIIIGVVLFITVVALACAILFGIRNARHSSNGDTSAAQNCSGLDRPFNGDVTYSNGTNIGSTAVFACALGYELVGPNLKNCLESGQWVPQIVVACKRRECGLPKHLNNGQIAFLGTFFGDSVSYQCNVGYTLQGPGVKTCTDKTKWEPVQPNKCEIQECGRPQEIINGYMQFSSGTVFGSSVTFRCQNGYTLVGTHEKKCSSEGIWEPEEETQCIVYDCDNLNDLRDGKIVYTKGNLFGSYAFFRCNPGYELVILSSDSSILQHKQCYSNNDPHMKTFDGIDVPVFCNCGVMISSGRDIFVVNNCDGNGIWDVRFRSCVDGVLNNRVNKISIYHFQVSLQSGTIVDLSLQEKFVNVAVFPSLADVYNTEGLCGRFDGDSVNDRYKRPGSLERNPMLSWKLLEHEDLFGEKYILENVNEPLKRCSCNTEGPGLNSCSHGSAKLCQFEPSFTQSCNVASRKRRSTLKHRIGDYHGPFGVCSLKRNTGTGPLAKRLEKRSSLQIENYDHIRARDQCLKVINTTAFRLCEQVPGMNIDTFIGDCVLDVVNTNNVEWALIHLELIKQKCLFDVKVKRLPPQSAMENLTLVMNDTFIDNTDNQTLAVQEASTEEFLKEIMDASCPLECNQRGLCNKGKCVCETGFTGVDCTTKTYLPPEIHGLPDDGLCDFRNTGTIISTEHVFLTGAKLNTFMEAECGVNTRSLKKREVEGTDELGYCVRNGKCYTDKDIFNCRKCIIHEDGTYDWETTEGCGEQKTTIINHYGTVDDGANFDRILNIVAVVIASLGVIVETAIILRDRWGRRKNQETPHTPYVDGYEMPNTRSPLTLSHRKPWA